MKDIGALSTATFFFSLCMHLPHQVCLLHFSIVENTKHGIRIMLKKKRPTKSARPLFTILRHERNLKDKRTQSFRILIYHKFREKFRDLKVIIFPKNKISANWDETGAALPGRLSPSGSKRATDWSDNIWHKVLKAR